MIDEHINFNDTDEYVDDSNGREYFSMTPNIIFEMGLTTNELAVYCFIKRVAGDNGKCFRGQRSICKKLKIGDKTLAEAKEALELKGLISIKKKTKKQGGQHVIQIVDIWSENMMHSLKLKKKLRDVEQRHPLTLGNVTKKNPLKKKRKQHPLTPSSKSETPKVKKKVVVSSKNIKEKEKAILEKIRKKWEKEKRDPDLIEESFKIFKNRDKSSPISDPPKWMDGVFKKLLQREEEKEKLKELTKFRERFCKEDKPLWRREKDSVSAGYEVYRFDKDDEFWKKFGLDKERFEEYEMSKKTNKRIKNPEENMFLVLSNRDKKG